MNKEKTIAQLDFVYRLVNLAKNELKSINTDLINSGYIWAKSSQSLVENSQDLEDCIYELKNTIRRSIDD